MFTFVVPAADFLPNILASLGLPPGVVYSETTGEQTGETKCTASVYCSSSGPDSLRVFTASSSVDAATAKHLAAILAIQHLKGLYHFTVIDVNHTELSNLKSSEIARLRSEITRLRRDKRRAQAAAVHFRVKAIQDQRGKAQLLRMSHELIQGFQQFDAETQFLDESDDSGTVSPVDDDDEEEDSP
ncbi:hypothetical protein M5689_018429 [Euphorbia peplus]|nr:hypothetical protein M5689_018429 [Euphorbia peplus]